MKSLRKIFSKFAEWFQPKYRFVYIDEIPEQVNEQYIYVIGDSKSPWLLAFNCPCGCKKMIQLNLLKDSDPCWKFKIVNKNKISISPSIWRTTGCKSHFFIHNSRVDWVRSNKSNSDQNSTGSFNFWDKI